MSTQGGGRAYTSAGPDLDSGLKKMDKEYEFRTSPGDTGFSYYECGGV